MTSKLILSICKHLIFMGTLATFEKTVICAIKEKKEKESEKDNQIIILNKHF